MRFKNGVFAMALFAVSAVDLIIYLFKNVYKWSARGGVCGPSRNVGAPAFQCGRRIACLHITQTMNDIDDGS